jgi:hypothetical protein
MSGSRVTGETGDCGDCGTRPGQPHEDGCDVARCTVCGWQRIGCEHGTSDAGWGEVWSGVWPGYAECRELGWFSYEINLDSYGPDLHRLALAHAVGALRWDGRRLVLARTVEEVQAVRNPQANVGCWRAATRVDLVRRLAELHAGRPQRYANGRRSEETDLAYLLDTPALEPPA